MPVSSRIELRPTCPGNSRWVQVERYGTPGSRPKAYLQAGLHADELPSVLVLDHLRRKLAVAQGKGLVSGEIVVVPIANPIGISQWDRDHLQGRYDFFSGDNFNRHFPAVFNDVVRAIDQALQQGMRLGVAEVRQLVSAAVDRYQPRHEADELKTRLLGLACDADIVLDLHCDSEAVMHLYLGESLWPLGEDLHRWTGSRVTMLADASGDQPFDESAGGIWWALAARFPELDLPPACLSATIEYRGEAQVSDTLAEQDAENLYRFLCGRGLIDEHQGNMPGPAGKVAPFRGVEMVRSPGYGVIAYRRHPGDEVNGGEVIATLSDPNRQVAIDPPIEIVAPISGLLFGRAIHRFARPGLVLCKIAGDTPLAHRVAGSLLND